MGVSQIEHKYNECNLICDLIPNLNRNYYNSLEEEDDGTVVASNKSLENRVSKDTMHRERAVVECRDDDNTCGPTIEKERRVEAQNFQQDRKHGQK